MSADLASPAAAAQPSASTPRLALVLVLLSAIVLAVYLSWGKSGFNYDDHVEFIPVPAPDSLAGTLHLFDEPSFPDMPYYRPVAKASLLLQKAAFGLQPLPFHVANALLAVAALLGAQALLSVPKFEIPKTLALGGALLFALHPIASSCVYPVAGGRYSLLVTVLMVGTMAAFLRPGRRAYALAMILLALALLSKEQAVVLLPLLILADWLGLSAEPPGRDSVRWLRRYLGPVAIFAAYFAARAWVFRGQHFDLQFLPRPLVTLLTPLYTLQTALVPTWELVYEPTRAATWYTPVRLALTLAVTGLFLVGILHQGRERRRVALFFSAWFIFGLLPAASFVSQDVAYDERYAFVSLLGVIGVAGIAAGAAWTRPLARRAILATVVLLVFGAGIVTLNRGRYFQDDLTFTRQWVRTSPHEFMPHYSLGVALADRQQVEAAMASYRRALALNPNWPDTHLNLSLLHIQRGELADALSRISDYVRLKPQSAKAHYSRGVVWFLSGRYVEAERSFTHSLALDPASAEAHHNLAATLQELHRPAEALAHYEAALRLDPTMRNSQQALTALRAQLAAGTDSAAGLP